MVEHPFGKVQFITKHKNYMKYPTLFLLLFQLTAQAQVHLGPNQTYPNIQAATNANAIQPGDTVYLHADSYAGYQAVTNLKGMATDWITITRYQQDPIDISGGWQFISCAYLRFQEMNFLFRFRRGKRK